MKINYKLVAFNSAENSFHAQYSNLLAHFDGDAVKQSLTAFVELNLAEELSALESWDIHEMRRLLERALASLVSSGTLSPIADLSVEAKEELRTLRQATGIGIETLAPDQPNPPSAEELLEQEVRADFVNLSGSKMMEKRRTNRAYEAMYQKIASTLDSRVTTAIDCGTF